MIISNRCLLSFSRARHMSPSMQQFLAALAQHFLALCDLIRRHYGAGCMRLHHIRRIAEIINGLGTFCE